METRTESLHARRLTEWRDDGGLVHPHAFRVGGIVYTLRHVRRFSGQGHLVYVQFYSADGRLFPPLILRDVSNDLDQLPRLAADIDALAEWSRWDAYADPDRAFIVLQVVALLHCFEHGLYPIPGRIP